MTTHPEAIADYQRLKARGGVADPLPATAPPEDPDAERFAAERHAISLLTPAGREAEAERVAAIAAAAPQTPSPAPREALGGAHQARADAQNEADRLQQALARARAHLVEATAARDGAQQGLEAVEAADTARLIDELPAGGSAGRVEPGGGAERMALAECDHQLEIATRAADKLADEDAEAEQKLAAAERAVGAAICAVLLDVAQLEAEAILADADALDARRASLDGLSMVIIQQQRGAAVRRPWPPAISSALAPELRGPPRLPSRVSTPAGADLVRRWCEAAAALADDPEAEIG